MGQHEKILPSFDLIPWANRANIRVNRRVGMLLEIKIAQGV
jgi:hypothetical protein